MRLLLCFVLLSFFYKLNAQDSTSVKFSKKEKSWYIPDYTKIQFAGNIGFVSIGVGYKVINKTLFTELLYGYAPNSYPGSKSVHLITLKNTFTILNKEVGKGYTFSPIAGLTTSIETGNNSFLKVPAIYPDDYYITNAVHFSFFIGALLHKSLSTKKRIKGIDFYLEVGTVDIYLWSALTNREVNFGDVFSSSSGLNFYF
jgi:hypothetical protein